MKALSPRFIPANFTPSEEQLVIQVAQSRTILLEANAGAAKTTTLALCAAEALARGVLASEILILVFTLEAQQVMRQRLLQIGVSKAWVEQIQIYRFEDFASQVLEQALGYQAESIASPQLLRPYVLRAMQLLIEQSGDQGGELEIATHNLAISQFLDQQLRLKASLQTLRIEDSLSASDAAYAAGCTLTDWLLFQVYEQQRFNPLGEAKFRGSFDATYDLACRLLDLEAWPLSLPHYSLLLCDELHDLNEAAFQLVMALLSSGKTRFIGAGDRDQVIHACLGADASFINHRFQEYDSQLQRLPLTTSYRYGSQLAWVVANLKQKTSVSGLSSETAVELLFYADELPGDGAHCVLAKLQALQQGAAASCAILIRERYQAIEIEHALVAAGIPYHTPTMKKYLQSDEILFVRGLIAIALKNLVRVSNKAVRASIVEALISYGEVCYSAEDGPDPIAYAKRTIAETPDLLNEFFKGVITRSGSQVSQRIGEVVVYLEGLPADVLAAEVLQQIYRRMDMASLIKRLYTYPAEAAIAIRSVERLLVCAQAWNLSLSQFADQLSKVENAAYSSQGGRVILECVANAKGMEFDHVLMPYLARGQFPDVNGLMQQESNLFYVGITRAKRSLTLFAPKQAAAQSVFLAQMALQQWPQTPVNQPIAPPSPVKVMPQRMDLKVPYSEKDQAKALGARWDPVRKVWYLEAGKATAGFERWLSEDA